MTSTPACHTGSPDPLPERRRLRAGPLTMDYEGGDLRYVRLGGREVVRRWTSALRDRNWGTVPARLANERFDIGPDRFRVDYDAEHRQGEIDFAWAGSITGTPDGSVTFRMEGTARSAFQRNRIGFCILHPIRECAGARCRFALGDGATGEGAFPRSIAPHNPFTELRAFAHEVAPGVWAELRFEGDLFEMEDQRNWIDASFKTFCTPLSRPFPVEVATGSKIRQTVTLTLTGAVEPDPDPGPADPVLEVRADRTSPLPGIGLCMSRPLAPRELDRVRTLRPAHLRVDLDLSAADLPDRLSRAAEAARQVPAPLEAALTLSSRAADELRTFVGLLREIRPPVARWLVFHHEAWSTPAPWIRLARSILAEYAPTIPIFSGTTANFRELNRERPPIDLLDGVCYSAQPQEHASDDASLVETCAALPDTVRTAREFCGSLPLAVTPITLRKRVNPYATVAGAGTVPLSARIDPRQKSLLGAGWTLGALKHLAESRVSSVTFYEVTGGLGVMEDESAAAFPLFHVLADAAATGILGAVSSRPLRVEGMALRLDAATRVMLANLSPASTTVTVTGLGARASVRVLDETTFERATRAPDEFRADPGEDRRTPGGRLDLTLRPYAYARVDTDA